MAFNSGPGKAKGRWQTAVKTQTQQQAARRKVSRPGWEGFRGSQIDILESFDSSGDSFDMTDGVSGGGGNAPGNGRSPRPSRATPATDEELLEHFKDSEDFLQQYLVLAMVYKPWELSKYVDMASRALVHMQERGFIESEKFWRDIFGLLYEKAVEMEDTRLLRLALALACDTETPKITKPEKNCPALVAACFHENLKLVKMFVSKGYRLKSSHFDEPEKHELWADMPFR